MFSVGEAASPSIPFNPSIPTNHCFSAVSCHKVPSLFPCHLTASLATYCASQPPPVPLLLIPHIPSLHPAQNPYILLNILSVNPNPNFILLITTPLLLALPSMSAIPLTSLCLCCAPHPFPLSHFHILYPQISAESPPSVLLSWIKVMTRARDRPCLNPGLGVEGSYHFDQGEFCSCPASGLGIMSLSRAGVRNVTVWN